MLYATNKIDYINVVSLYLWVCKHGKYPIGHLEILMKDFAKVSATEHPYQGLMKATILSTKGLVHSFSNNTVINFCKLWKTNVTKAWCKSFGTNSFQSIKGSV